MLPHHWSGISGAPTTDVYAELGRGSVHIRKNQKAGVSACRKVCVPHEDEWQLTSKCGHWQRVGLEPHILPALRLAHSPVVLPLPSQGSEHGVRLPSVDSRSRFPTTAEPATILAGRRPTPLFDTAASPKHATRAKSAASVNLVNFGRITLQNQALPAEWPHCASAPPAPQPARSARPPCAPPAGSASRPAAPCRRWSRGCGPRNGPT